MLTWIICLPLLAAQLTLFIPRNYRFVIRVVALAATLLTMLLTVKLFLGFDAVEAGAGGYKFGDFLKIGLLLDLVCWVLGSLAIPLIWM